MTSTLSSLAQDRRVLQSPLEKPKGEPDHLGLALRCAFSLRRTYFAIVIAMRICSVPVLALASSLSSALAFGTW